MKKRTLNTITGVCMLLICGGAWGDTCVKTTFNVTYSCNGGTRVGTLPADTTVQYGASFTPTAITESMCTPPSGYVYAGQAVIVDGETVANHSNDRSSFSGSTISFTYYYTTDIEVGPHWAPVARPETLASHIGIIGRTRTYTNGVNGTWTANFYYGAVSGVSKCTTVKPENTADGYNTGGLIADYDTIENAVGGGSYCYCKMTQPYIAASPWVFKQDAYGNASSCTSNCADYCSASVYHNLDASRRFRASVFAGAIN
ncbi:MAG: hypothetical protein R8M37_02755 [Alphaproteobacteria bacterium]|nr:hypothetical protein [Alphaproteobacteria bacterium]